MKAVIIGGTKGMGRALARKAAERGDRLFLLGRDDDDLARSAADLQVHDREGRKVGHFVCDMERPESPSRKPQSPARK